MELYWIKIPKEIYKFLCYTYASNSEQEKKREREREKEIARNRVILKHLLWEVERLPEGS